MDEMSSNRPAKILTWLNTHTTTTIPFNILLLESSLVHYVKLNVIMTALVFHRISNCWYMSSIVFCSGQLFGKRMRGFLKNHGGFFSHLCTKSRIVVGFWDFWELFLSPHICSYMLLNCYLRVFSHPFLPCSEIDSCNTQYVIKRIKQVNKNTFISSTYKVTISI